MTKPEDIDPRLAQEIAADLAAREQDLESWRLEVKLEMLPPEKRARRITRGLGASSQNVVIPGPGNPPAMGVEADDGSRQFS